MLAKVMRPTMQHSYPRSRLFEWLESPERPAVIWLAAPAGSGKTTLVSSYVESRKVRCLWYQLDEDDGDLATFFHYLGIAAKQAAPRHRTPLPALTPEFLPGLDTFARRYFERLSERLKPPAVIVLDNYQTIAAESPLHEVLCLCASRLPPGVRLIVSSRAEPPPAFARLRTHGEVALLHWDEMKLTLDETRGIAAIRLARAKRTCSAECIERLHAKTQGWAAGLVLSLDRAVPREVAIGLVDETTQQVLFDYFAAELFDRVPAAARDVLLKTAVLPKMTVRMAESLTGEPETRTILRALHRNNFFLVKREETEATFEFHPLFREFLKVRGRETFGDPEIAELNRRAAALLAEAGQTEEAVALYQASADWPNLVPLILKEAPALLARGRHQVLAQWLRALPAELVEQNGWLRYWCGMSLLPFDPRAGRGHLQGAFALFERQADAAGLYLSWAGIVDSINFEYSDFTLLDPWVAALGRVRARHRRFPSLEVELRVHSVLIALTHRPPRHPAPARWAARALELLETCSDASQGVMLGAHLLHFYAYGGDAQKAERVIEAVERLARCAAVSPLSAVFWCAAQALYSCYKVTPRAGLERVEEGLALARHSGMHVLDGILNGLGAWESVVAGDQARAERYLRDMAQAPTRDSPVQRSFYHYVSAGLWQQRGDPATALDHCRRALALSLEAGALGPEAHTHIAIAPLLFQSGEDREAAEHLRKARALGERTGSLYVEYACLMAEAAVALERGQETRCLDRLARALNFSRQSRGFTAGLTGPWTMALLCAKALEGGIEVPYVQDLIRRHRLTPPDPTRAPETWPWPIKVYTLGRFSLVRDGETLRFTGKTQKKPLELLAAILALGGRDVPQGELADLLWPDSEGDAAYRALVTNVQRLRHFLGHPEAVLVTESALSLDPRYVWVDAWAFERLLQASDEAGKSGSPPAAGALCERALGHYRGPFLQKTGAPWAGKLRERLRAKHLQRLLEQGRLREDTGDREGAAGLYRRGIEADPVAAPLYQALIHCYEALGREIEARALQERLRKISGAPFGTKAHYTARRFSS